MDLEYNSFTNKINSKKSQYFSLQEIDLDKMFKTYRGFICYFREYMCDAYVGYHILDG